MTVIHLASAIAGIVFALTRALGGPRQHALFKLLQVEIARFSPDSTGSSLWL